MRVGFGYDSHVFEAGKPLVLGGVAIPGCDGLKAHSDGDVLIHAVIDALFGAAALGDIGSHFPDSDERWRGADSSRLLAQAVDELALRGFRVGRRRGGFLLRGGATVICERPRLRPHVDAIRGRLAALLRVDASRVSVKGKTNEGMDAVGAGAGIVAHAAVLLDEASSTE